MPRVLHRELRFYVIDRCLRDTQVNHNIATITAACNKMLMASYGVQVSRRTVQYDLSILRREPFGILLDEKLLRFGIYRYADVDCEVPYINGVEGVEAQTEDEHVVCTLVVARSAMTRLEEVIYGLGPSVVVKGPETLKTHICKRLNDALMQYQ